MFTVLRLPGPSLNPPFWISQSLACIGVPCIGAAPVGLEMAVRGSPLLGWGLWAFLAVPSHNASGWGCQATSPLPSHMSIQPPALCECRYLCCPLPPRHGEICESLQTSHPGKEEQRGKKNKLRTRSVPSVKLCSLLIRCERAGLHVVPKTDADAAFSLC